MIDIELVSKMEDTALLDRIAAEKKSQETAQKRHREAHAQVLLDIANGKTLAEKEIPVLLKKLQENIACAIENKRTNVELTCGNYNDNEWKVMHLKIMLSQMLPLKGIACKFSKDDFRNVIVSW